MSVSKIGRGVALAGLVLPLLLIGGLKFTQFEIDALEPLISGAPWLAWMYPAFGKAGTSYLLGVVEITTALLLIASARFPGAGVAAGALGTLIFFTTTSLLFALPIWEPAAGGSPALNAAGSFLIKDVALLGVSLVVLGEGMERTGLGARASRE
jgi:reactive chlorine resistance protein C